MPNTTYGDLDPRIGGKAEKEMLAHAEPELVTNLFGLHKRMPKNKGTKIIFRRPVPLPPALVPLVEGVNPNSNQFRYEDVEADLQEWGDWVELTNKITDLHEDEVGKDMAAMLGEQAARTIEKITWGEMIGGTNVIYANNVVGRANVTGKLSLGMLRQAVRVLKAQKARPFTKILKGGAMFGTKPVQGGFVALCHSDLDPHIRELKGFIPVAEYGTQKPLSDHELGAVENVRFITTAELDGFADAGGAAGGSLISTSGTNCDVYPIMVFGQEAYGCIPLKGDKNVGGYIKPKVKLPGAPTRGDEMGRFGSVSWLTWFVAKRLNEGWLVRLEVAADIDAE